MAMSWVPSEFVIARTACLTAFTNVLAEFSPGSGGDSFSAISRFTMQESIRNGGRHYVDGDVLGSQGFMQ